MPKMKLTQLAVDKLKPPASGRVEYWDAILPAFGLRVAAARSGQEPRKTWQVMYRVRGKKVRETLGTLAAIRSRSVTRPRNRSSAASKRQKRGNAIRSAPRSTATSNGTP